MNISKSIYEFVAANPLCYTEDVANHINRSAEHTAKILYILEERDSVRCPVKNGRRNRWIVGLNDKFNNMSGRPRNFYRGGNPYGTGGGNGAMINRKRVITVAVTAQDALALLSAGVSKMVLK